jgi:hypothetical protein
MARTYDPDLDNVYVSKSGVIRWDGDDIGLVYKTEGPALGKWRAEIGNPANPDAWPPYRASYAGTRNAAVADVLENLEVPE